MDTRKKIVSRAELPPGTAIVAGTFDPLTAAHLEALEQSPHPLAVLVLDPVDPILPTRARAELIAGLRTVDYVITEPGPVAADHSPSHAVLALELTRHVARRHGR